MATRTSPTPSGSWARRSKGSVEPAGGAPGGLRQGFDRASDLLRTLVPLAARLVRVVRTYALTAGIAALLVVVAVAWRLAPWSFGEIVGVVVLMLVLAAPVGVLWLFGQALEEVAELPDRVSRFPDTARTNVAELGRLAEESRRRRSTGSPGSLPRDLWRAGRLLLGAHDSLPGYGAVLTLVRVPFLIASAIAAAAAAVIIVLALPVTAGLVLTALL
jgi:hypothetical protein